MRHQWLTNASRIVVKLGTGVLTDSRRQLDLPQIRQLAAQLAALAGSGKEIVVVSSGAVGAGMGVLGHTRRPRALAELQACAAVGQSRLMAVYEGSFAEFGRQVAQVLLTHDDVADHDRHLNARNTLLALLDRGIIPIVNENDAVSFTELKFGDNDTLSALVACLLPADLLIILTTVEGVLRDFGTDRSSVISTIDQINELIEKSAGKTTNPTAVGGMVTKIQAAKIVVRAGIPLVIASGRVKDVLPRLLAGSHEGTLFIPHPNKLRGRKRWIAFFRHPKGTLVVDEGAKIALRENGKSLLPPGILRCEGRFAAGEIVRVCDGNGTEFARGISQFDSAHIVDRHLPRSEVIHRDNLVLL